MLELWDLPALVVLQNEVVCWFSSSLQTSVRLEEEIGKVGRGDDPVYKRAGLTVCLVLLGAVLVFIRDWVGASVMSLDDYERGELDLVTGRCNIFEGLDDLWKPFCLDLSVLAITHAVSEVDDVVWYPVIVGYTPSLEAFPDHLSECRFVNELFTLAKLKQTRICTHLFVSPLLDTHGTQVLATRLVDRANNSGDRGTSGNAAWRRMRDVGAKYHCIAECALQSLNLVIDAIALEVYLHRDVREVLGQTPFKP